MAQLYLIGVISGKEIIFKEIEQVIEDGPDFVEDNKEKLQEIGKDPSWERVVVLGDSELQGIAAEAAIAFKEIPQVHSNYYHLLDVRHGPMVLIDEKTLVIMACSPSGDSYQKDLIEDLQKKGAKIVTTGNEEQKSLGSDYHISVASCENFGVTGIPFIFVPQVIAYYKAVARGINPDQPQSLDPWIEL